MVIKGEKKREENAPTGNRAGFSTYQYFLCDLNSLPVSKEEETLHKYGKWQIQLDFYT